MATGKEISLINEITFMAMNISQKSAEIAVSASYIGHVNVFELRMMAKPSLEVIGDPFQWAHLTGRDGSPFTEDDSISALTAMRDSLAILYTVDADGVPI